MRLNSLLIALAAVSAQAAALHSRSTNYHVHRFERVRKDLKQRSSASKGLIISTPDEYDAYKSHLSEFDFIVNYQSTITVDTPLEFIPDESASTFQSRAQAAIKAGSKWVSDLNEPNQSGISGATGAKNFKSIIQPVLNKNPGVKAIIGQISANDEGIQYIQDFLKACDGCSIGAVGFHCLRLRTALTIADRDGRSVSTGLSNLKDFTAQVKAVAGGHSLFVTEYGSVRVSTVLTLTAQRASDSSQVASFISAATSLLQSMNSIDAIFAFPHLSGSPFVDDGSLTKLAKAYLSA